VRAHLALVLFSLSCPIPAHDFTFTDVTLTLTEDRFRVEMVWDLDALALGQPPRETDSGEMAEMLAGLPETERDAIRDRLTMLFERRVRVRFDDEPRSFSIAFPEEGEARPDGVEPSWFGTIARLEGSVPEGAETVSFFASRAFPAMRLTLAGPDGPIGEAVPLPGGQRSEAYVLAELEPASWSTIAWRYLVLGFYHILPLGLDHILFVLGLFLFCRTTGPLLWQVSAFTLAHTLTLGLAAGGIVSLPSRPVEILIAASIVYVAVENIFGDKLRPHRVAVVFGFGLLHGLGFAGVLGELGLPERGFLTALFAFNIGVELGQLAVIAGAMLLVGWWRKADFYKARIVVPCSIAIGLVGAYWVVERMIG